MFFNSFDSSLVKLRRDFTLKLSDVVLMQVAKVVSPTMVLVTEGPYHGVCSKRADENLIEKGFYLFTILQFESAPFRLVLNHIGPLGSEVLHYYNGDSDIVQSNEYRTSNNYIIRALDSQEREVVNRLRSGAYVSEVHQRIREKMERVLARRRRGSLKQS